MSKTKKSKVEKIKESSDFLRAPIAEELGNDLPNFSKDSYQILKFHGTYQQDDRDLREGRNRHWMFMIRGRIPGGKLTAEQYLAIDDIADKFGDKTIRVTTRQAFQLYGIIKQNLKQTFREINDSMITTLGACGDVVRNVMVTPAPDINGRQKQVQEFADNISDRLLPATKAYHEIWLNGEKVETAKTVVNTESEPIYGERYLPRKFKIGLTIPRDNSIDLYTQDIGLVAIFNDQNRIEGFNVVVGGGLGMHHKKPETFPRLGDHLGYVPVDQVYNTVEGIVKVQRDLGNRANRKRARMKYLIDEIGIEKFKQELVKRTGFEPEPFKELPDFEPDLYLGWNKQSDGKWFLGVSIENGRIKDDDHLTIKSAFQKIAREYSPGFRLTPNHNVLLTDVNEADKNFIDEILRDHGVLPDHEIPNVLKHSMACPALPTCGLAITESERVFPDVIQDLQQVLTDLGLQDDLISVRMTGCPNGCARPYVADIGFVGRSLEKYTVFIGGNPAGTRLAKVYKDLVPLDELVNEVRPLLEQYSENRSKDESFGDYWDRVGFENILQETTTI
jgi:sulfite reductase (ferredoxin)